MRCTQWNSVTRTVPVYAGLAKPLLRPLQTAQYIHGQDGMGEIDLPGFDLPDPIAMAVALDPSVATVTKHLHVAIETHSELTRGATVVDHMGITGNEPNADVVLEASCERFLEILHAAVRST